MRRSVAISFVVAISSVWPLAAQRPQPRPSVPIEYITTLNNALKAYTAGDDLAVESLLHTKEGIASTLALEAVFGRPSPWTRARAAFLAEMAVAAPLSNRGKLGAILIGRVLAVSRPDLPGKNATDDRVEILAHQIALAVLQEHKLYTNQLDYIDGIAPRFNQAASAGAVLDTRFSLALGIAASGLCCPARSIDPVRVIVSGPPRLRPRVTSDVAVAVFNRAATDPKIGAEALVRGAVLQFNLDHPAEALAWLDRVPADYDDKLLHYAHSLLRGRVLDILGRPEESAPAYAAACTDFPDAQTPAIGRAAALLRTGETAEAVRLAAAARVLPPDAPDPWVDFLKADARFVKGWLAEIRSLRK